MVVRKISDLQPVLKDASLTGDSVVYTVGPRPDGLVGDVTTISPVMLSQEFPKTYGHYHQPPHSETYTVKSGRALVLTQKIDVEGQLLDFQHHELKAGESFTVPEGYGHVLVNIGSEPLVTWDNWNPAWAKHVYDQVAAKHGFAYYVVRGQSGAPQFVQNPAYFPKRKGPRLPDFDYSQGGWYFVTVCTEDKRPLFGEVKKDEFVPNKVGEMVEKWWRQLPDKFAGLSLDVFQTMPTHFHGIVSIDDYFVGADPCIGPSMPPKERIGQGLFRIMQWFKTMSTNEYLRFIKSESGRTHGFAPTIRHESVASEASVSTGSSRSKLWQRNYYEHVIRNEKDLARIREYIAYNPLEWGSDEENPDKKLEMLS